MIKKKLIGIGRYLPEKQKENNVDYTYVTSRKKGNKSSGIFFSHFMVTVHCAWVIPITFGI